MKKKNQIKKIIFNIFLVFTNLYMIVMAFIVKSILDMPYSDILSIPFVIIFIITALIFIISLILDIISLIKNYYILKLILFIIYCIICLIPLYYGIKLILSIICSLYFYAFISAVLGRPIFK